MKINPAPFHLAQMVLNGLVVVLSLAILGTSAHTLDMFNKQQSSNPWWLPLWRQHFDVHGTQALVASSVVTLVLCGGFLVAFLLPQLALRQKYTLRALLSLATILPSLLLMLVTVIYSFILNGNAPEIDTIQTWTCKYKASHPLAQDMEVPSNMGNSNFKSLCEESKFALYGSLVVFLLLGGSMGLTVVTWLADKFAARQSRKDGSEMSQQS